jgi:hypothetical protein
VGVVSASSDDGNRKMLLPDGSVTRVAPGLTDDEIVALYDLDTLRHARKVRWGEGNCIDGPRAGDTSYVADELGSRVVMGRHFGEKGDLCEVVGTSDDTGFASLRFVPDGTP